MSHLSDNKKLIQRVRRLRGQIESVERMLIEGADCYKTLQNVAACRGSLNSLTRELILEHIEHHLIAESASPQSIREASKELQSIIASYLK
jgi:DNA-binding FrmR family transcriptional regulator